MLSEFVQQVENTAKDVLSEIHTAIPGRILSINPKDCTADIKPLGSFKGQNGKTYNFPVVTEVPIAMPCSTSSGIGVYVPLKQGDNCLLVISERSLDQFWTGAKTDSELLFDLTNAICIPGLISSTDSQAKSALKESLSTGTIVVNGNLKVVGDITYTGKLTKI